jgi:riboflavin kinase
MYPFANDFYGHEMKAVVLGYIRPELDYVSRGISKAFLDYRLMLTELQRH